MTSQRRTLCPVDNGFIPEVGGYRDSPIRAVNFYRCCYCMELFAFLDENEGRHRLVAGFARDQNAGCWRVFKAYGPDEEVQFALKAIPQLDHWGENSS